MSDMVQQPVIQLVQELTMTAVVERHDCTDTKKEEKSRSPRPCSNTNDAFIIPPSLKISPIWHIWVEERDSSRHLSVIIQKLDLCDIKEMRISRF